MFLFFGLSCCTADDAIAILMAFQSPDLEVLGLTTIFGNIDVRGATKNALHLVNAPPLFSVCIWRSLAFHLLRFPLFVNACNDLFEGVGSQL